MKKHFALILVGQFCCVGLLGRLRDKVQPRLRAPRPRAPPAIPLS